jgi:hypothetical protein
MSSSQTLSRDAASNAARYAFAVLLITSIHHAGVLQVVLAALAAWYLYRMVSTRASGPASIFGPPRCKAHG